jgi:hypothetical protein
MRAALHDVKCYMNGDKNAYEKTKITRKVSL